MPMVNQQIQIPFTGGPDQRQAPEYLDPAGRLLDIQNGVYKHDGGVEKRNGVQALSSAQIGGDPVMGTPVRLLTHGRELSMTDGDGLFSYASSGLWSFRGNVSPCVATRSPLLSNAAAGHTSFSVAEANGYRMVAYRTFAALSPFAGDIYVSVFDETSGAEVITNSARTSGGTYYNPVGIALGTYYYLFYNDTANIYCQILNLTTMTWGAAAPLVSGLLLASSVNRTVGFDASPYSTGNGILLAYAQSAGGLASNVVYLRLEALPALTISGSGTLTSSGASTYVAALSVRHNAALGYALVAWETVNGATYTQSAQALSTSTWTAFGSTFHPTIPSWVGATWLLAAMPLNAGQALFVGCFNTAGGFPAQTTGYAIYNVVAGTLAYVGEIPSSVPVGTPFLATSGLTTRPYFPLVFAERSTPTSSFEASSFLVDASASMPRITATLAPRQSNYSFVASDLVLDWRLSITTMGLGVYRNIVAVSPSEEFAASSTSAFIDLAQWDFTGTTGLQCAEGVGETFLSGGVPSVYDGAGPQEIGFLVWPSLSGSPYVITPMGGSITGGEYGYAFCYAFSDAAGQIHRSSTYELSEISISANASVTWTLPNLPFSQHYLYGRVPVIEIYRTQANGTTLYYVGSVPCVDSLTSSVTYVDIQSDAAIATKALLYTTGGVLDSVCPPSFRCTIKHNNRVWGIDDTGYVVWYSTPFNTSDAPYFNEALTLQWEDGPLTALAELDDKLIVFSSKQVWYLTGDGPANTGQGSDLSNPLPLPLAVGPADWRSVVSTPNGVMFQDSASGGIYLLDRGLQLSYVGKAVQDWMAGNTILSATVTASTSHVRFVLSGGSVLVYDYTLDRWSRFFYSALGPPTTSAVCQGSWTGASPTNIFQEQTGSYLDKTYAGVGTWVTLLVQSGWIKVGGLQGYQRLRHLGGYGTWLESADIFVTATYDYGEQVQGTQYLYRSLSAANSAAAQWDMHAMATAGKAMSVQVTLTDGAPTAWSYTTGQGARFLGLTFDVQSLASRYMRLPSAVKA